MAEWTLSYPTEIINGASYKVKAEHLTGNFTGLKSDIDDRLSKTTASAQTVTGAVTFSAQPTLSAGVKTNTISEETAAAGVTVDGVLLKDNQVSTNVINELTAAAGVTADSVLLKDGMVTVAGTPTSNGQIGYASNVLTAYINGAQRTLATTADISTPGLVYISTQTASASSQLVFTSGIDSTYDEYELHLIDIVPGTDNVGLYLQTSSDGGSSYDSGVSDYQWARGFHTAAGTGTNSGDTADAQLVLGLELGTGTGETFNGVLKLFKPSGTSVYKMLQGNFTQYSQTPSFFGFDFSGIRLSASAVNALKFYPSSGNIASGAIRLYGVRKS